MKLSAEVQTDGKIIRVIALEHQPAGSHFVEISDSDMLKTFEDMDPHYWDGTKVISKPLPPNIAAYYQDLGAFVQAFAAVEATMHGALRRFCGITSAVARSIFSGTRAEAAKQLITRIMDTKNLDSAMRSELKYVFNQLGVINSARNEIIHHGTQFEGEQFTVSNALLAHLPERIRELEVSPKILEFMTADLNKITLHILVCLMRLDSSESEHFFRNHLAPILQRPWLYKPTQLIPRE